LLLKFGNSRILLRRSSCRIAVAGVRESRTTACKLSVRHRQRRAVHPHRHDPALGAGDWRQAIVTPSPAPGSAIHPLHRGKAVCTGLTVGFRAGQLNAKLHRLIHVGVRVFAALNESYQIPGVLSISIRHSGVAHLTHALLLARRVSRCPQSVGVGHVGVRQTARRSVRAGVAQRFLHPLVDILLRRLTEVGVLLLAEVAGAGVLAVPFLVASLIRRLRLVVAGLLLSEPRVVGLHLSGRLGWRARASSRPGGRTAATGRRSTPGTAAALELGDNAAVLRLLLGERRDLGGSRHPAILEAEPLVDLGVWRALVQAGSLNAAGEGARVPRLERLNQLVAGAFPQSLGLVGEFSFSGHLFLPCDRGEELYADVLNCGVFLSKGVPIALPFGTAAIFCFVDPP